MSDKIDVIVKRAAHLLLHASNLAMREDADRARELSNFFNVLDAYLTERGNLGAGWEPGDPPLDGEPLFRIIHNLEEAEALTAYIQDHARRYAEFREKLKR